MFFEADGNRLREVLVADGFDIRVDMAIEHIDDTGGINGEGGVMCDHNNCVTLGMNSFELFHHDMGRAGVEVTGGLVGKDNLGFGN